MPRTRLRRGLQRLAVSSVGLAVVGISSLLIGPTGAHAAPATEQCATPSPAQARAVPWAQERLLPKRAWDLTKGAGITVAVVDSGVDASVPQLAGRVLPGVDVVGGGLANNDCLGHGTFVAGIIAAQQMRGTGVVGVAPQVEILPIRQTNSAEDGTAADMAEAIRAAVDGGADVINVSVSSFLPDVQLQAAVQYAEINDVLIVAAVSNEAEQGNPTAYPAAYPQVLAVGAIDKDGNRSEFSEFGDALDIVAPGVNVTGLSRASAGHLVGDGTSFAAPFVAGVAALVRAEHPDLSAAQVKHRIEATADHPGTALPSPQLGWGVVNPWGAVTAVLAEESGQATAAQPVAAQIEPAKRPVLDTRSQRSALEFVALAAALAAVAGTAAVAVPRGMRRGWAAASVRSEKTA
jgi:membrane-anchored mycosin MYCP